jgi:hypothetical protein
MDIVSEAVVDEGVPSSNATNPILNPQPEPIGEQKESVAEDTPPVEKVEDPIPKGVQKRIDRAVRQKYEAEARSKMLEERVAAMEARQSAPQQQRQADTGEPTIDKFDNFDEYVAAKAEYIAGKKIEATLTEREQRQQAERETAERRKTADSWTKRIAAATVEMPDFEEVLASSDVPMTPPMQQAIMESDIGPKLAYYLANNPDEAEKIAGMSPIGAIRTLGRIEERLASAKPEVKTTNAPPPLKPIGSKAVVTKDPGKMSDAEYDKWRKSGRAA